MVPGCCPAPRCAGGGLYLGPSTCRRASLRPGLSAAQHPKVLFQSAASVAEEHLLQLALSSVFSEPHVAFRSEPHSFLQGLRSCMDRISCLSAAAACQMLPQRLITSGLPVLAAWRPWGTVGDATGETLRVTSASCFLPPCICLAASCVVWWAGPPAGSRLAAVRGTMYVDGCCLACTHQQMAGWGIARTRPGLVLGPP